MTTEVYYRTLQDGVVGEQVRHLRPEDIDQLLHILENDAPFGATLHAMNDAEPDTAPAHELVAGLRDGRGALYFNDDHGTWYSSGPTPADADGPVYADVDFPPRCEITRDELAAALAEFLSHGRRPTCTTWQEEPDFDH